VDIGIVGGSGYGGAELIRLLAAHPSLRVRTVAAGSTAGQPLAAVFPHLAGSPLAGVLLAPSEAEALAGCDLVFLATPHEVSMALAPALLAGGASVVDLSGAFRLDVATFEDAYRMPHTAPELAPALYGLPELFRADLSGLGEGPHLVASPGCYPTAAGCALVPLAGLVDPASVAITGLSGTSGAGKGLRADLHVTHAIANVGAYGAPAHRHAPEIAQTWSRVLGSAAPVTFVPHLVPMARGLLCTATATLAPDAGTADVRAAFAKAYDDEAFVTLLPEGVWPQTAHVSGGNGAQVGVAVDAAGRVIASCAIDNLVKGAAGQALQAANLVLGQPEDAGLTAAGMYP
jgi:N-acetyl-gamma-glutamyl-phosphate reductase